MNGPIKGIAANALDEFARSADSHLTGMGPMDSATALGRKIVADWSKLGKPNNDSTSPIDIIDLFCGCGGASAGFLAINNYVKAFRLIGALDIDAEACETYQQLGIEPIQTDIRQIVEDTRKLQKFLAKVRDDPARPLVLIGCPPCQGFSSHHKKNWSKVDERNGLVEYFAKIAVSINPDYVFMENVPELLSSKYWSHYAEYKSTLESAGYKVLSTIVNMAEFGLPQERHRAIVLASRRQVSLPKPFLTHSEFTTVRDAISHLDTIEPGVPSKRDPMHVTSRHRASTIDVIRAVPKDGGSRPKGVGPKCLDRVKGFSDVYGRMRWDEPAITITAFSRNPASGRYVHPDQDRGLSIREAAILQGFPWYFEFKGTFDSRFSQIGNAVPPLFVAYMAAHILGDLANGGEPVKSISSGGITQPVSNSFSSVIAARKMSRRKGERRVPAPVAIDAFCGAGGLSLGLSQSGFGIALAYDNEEIAVKTYENNLGDHVVLKDAYSMDILGQMKEKGIKRNEVVLFAGGPPCQGFSVQRRGEDSDSRNDLVRVFLEHAFQVRPRFILMENVPGISTRGGRMITEYAKNECARHGYYCHTKNLNAADFGAPQIRKRFFLVAERIDGSLPRYEFPSPTFTPESYKTVRDAIGDLPSPPSDGSEHPSIRNHRCDRLSEANRVRFAHVPQSGGREDIPEELRLPCHRVSANKAGHRYVYGRLNWDKPSGVITARFDSLTRGRFGHPVETRSISLREGARLQTFPDGYVFVGTKVQVARQIGNAVPPVLAEAIGKSILAAMKRKLTR